MLVRVDKQVVSSLMRVRNDKALMDYLKREVNESLLRLADTADEVAFRQAQGKVKFLLDLLDTVEKSPEIAGKLGA